MLGVYDFCGHYDWTFAWLSRLGGDALVREYWDTAVHRDAQVHAAALISQKGFAGMEEYWGHTLQEEGAAYHTTSAPGVFRIDMHDCPSKGFLIRNGLERFHDYCDHCMGWIGPMLKESRFTIDHQHNHCGQCWWELRRANDDVAASEPGTLAGEQDVRLKASWCSGKKIDTYQKANAPGEKI